MLDRLRGLLRTHWVFVVVLGLGVALRLAFMVALRQPLMTYTDANVYVQAAQEGLFRPLDGRTAGYPLFLRLTHGIVDTPSFPVVLQHLMALGSCVLLYMIGLAVKVPRAWAALAAGVWAVSIDWMWLEHQLLTETLGMTLLIGALAVFALARAGRFPALPVVIGLGVAAAVLGMGSGIVRPAFFAAMPGIGLAALLLPRMPLRARIVGAMTLVLASGALLGGYLKLQEHQTGFSGGIIGTWLDLGAYPRVAPVADCKRFRVPRGTESLCQRSPTSTRPGPDYYYWAVKSPARLLLARRPESLSAIHLWAQRASNAEADQLRKGQLVAFQRLFGLGGASYSEGDQGPDVMSMRDADVHPAAVTVEKIKAYYGEGRAPNHPAGAPYGLLVALQGWTRPPGLLLLVSLLVTLAGAVCGRGIARRATIAIAVAGWVPVLYGTWVGSQYNWRYAVVGVPLIALAVAAAFAALRERRRGSVDTAAADSQDDASAQEPDRPPTTDERGAAATS